MKMDFESVLAHLNDVLSLRDAYLKGNQGRQYKGLSTEQEEDLYTAYVHALERCAPPSSIHFHRLRELTSPESLRTNVPFVLLQRLEGVLTALRRDWCGMRMETFAELIHLAMFENMLDASAYLLDESYHGPAAVMAGAVLEQHVRRLCDKHGVPTTIDRDGDKVPKKLDGLNNELAKHYANGKQDQKEVAALAGLRNAAAHGEFNKFDARQVEGMIVGIRGFINRNPA